MKTKTLIVAIAAIAAFAAGANAATNLVANGSFEEGGTGSPPWSSVPNWTGGGGSHGFGPGSIWSMTPPDGTNLAVFGGSGSYDGYITLSGQKVNLAAGQDYTFSFDSAGVSAYNSSWAPVAWESGKMGIHYFFFYDYPVGDPRRITMVDAKVYPTAVNSWTTSTHTVTAPISGDATIHAYLFNNGWSASVANAYVGADNFRVTAVPEPGTIVAAAGLLGLLALFRRRRA